MSLNKLKVSAVIFDLDGVLCSTDECHYAAWSQVSHRLGVPFDRGLNDKLRGVSRMDSLNIILSSAGIELPPEEREAICSEKNAIYRTYLAALTPQDAPRDTTETLAYLRAGGYRLAVGSSSKNAGLILERLGIRIFFDAVADGTDIKNSKPDPEVFQLAARRLGLPSSCCLVVEDSPAGIEAAACGGFPSAALPPARSDSGLNLHGLSELMRYL